MKRVLLILLLLSSPLYAEEKTVEQKLAVKLQAAIDKLSEVRIVGQDAGKFRQAQELIVRVGNDLMRLSESRKKPEEKKE